MSRQPMLRLRVVGRLTIGLFGVAAALLMAEMDTELEIAEQYIDRCLRAAVDKELTAVQASKAKWWCTELGKKVVDSCLQLHGGYGYMNEYRVAKDYVDVRIQTIYGGTTEIMKEIIGRSLGL